MYIHACEAYRGKCLHEALCFVIKKSLLLRSTFDRQVFEYTGSLIASPVDLSCSLLLHSSDFLPTYWVSDCAFSVFTALIFLNHSGQGLL